MIEDGHTEGCCGWILEFSWTTLILLSSPSLQEEVLPLLCALRCLHTWWAAFNETKGEVWVEETFSTMVFNTCSLQVNMSIGKWVICLTCKCLSVCIWHTWHASIHLSTAPVNAKRYLLTLTYCCYYDGNIKCSKCKICRSLLSQTVEWYFYTTATTKISLHIKPNVIMQWQYKMKAKFESSFPCYFHNFANKLLFKKT